MGGWFFGGVGVVLIGWRLVDKILFCVEIC